MVITTTIAPITASTITNNAMNASGEENPKEFIKSIMLSSI